MEESGSRDSDGREGDVDREMKELQIKKMKAEIRRINEQTANEEVVRAEKLVRIEEGRERAKLFKCLNLAFPNLLRHFLNNSTIPPLACQLVQCLIGNDPSSNQTASSSHDPSNSASSQSNGTPNLLQEAFAETINHAE